MQRLAVIALATGMAATCGANPAKASVSVTYTTSGIFTSSGTDTSTATSGASSVKVKFTGADTTTDPIGAPFPSSGEDFGTFNVKYTPANTTASFTLTDTFTLTITQIDPTNGSANVSATLAGTIKISSSQAYLDFETGTKTIGSVTYAVDFNDSSFPGRVNLKRSGNTFLTGTVNAVPEPASLAMVFAGLPMVGLVAWRHKRRNPA